MSQSFWCSFLNYSIYKDLLHFVSARYPLNNCLILKCIIFLYFSHQYLKHSEFSNYNRDPRNLYSLNCVNYHKTNEFQMMQTIRQ